MFIYTAQELLVYLLVSICLFQALLVFSFSYMLSFYAPLVLDMLDGLCPHTLVLHNGQGLTQIVRASRVSSYCGRGCFLSCPTSHYNLCVELVLFCLFCDNDLKQHHHQLCLHTEHTDNLVRVIIFHGVLLLHDTITSLFNGRFPLRTPE